MLSSATRVICLLFVEQPQLVWTLRISTNYSLKFQNGRSRDTSFLLPIEFGVQDLPAVQVTEDDAKEISFGRFIAIDSQEPLVAAFFQGDKVLAIMEKRNQVYKPRKVLSQ